MADEVLLVGNPNTGKTTLFNTLSKSNEKASNWHGVTVMAKSKKCKIDEREVLLTDLPGLYSLEGFSNEEKEAVKYLFDHKECLVVYVCDANNFKRCMRLCFELLKNEFKVVVAVNMSNEIKLYDYEKISEGLGVEFVEIDARKSKGVAGLKRKIADVLNNKKPQKNIKNIKNNININAIVIKNAKNNKIEPYSTSDKIDKFVLNKYIFPILFLSVIIAVFYLTFGAFGSWVSGLFNSVLNGIIDKMRKMIFCTNISNIVKIFMNDALLNTVQSVFSFLPQIVLLMFFFNLIEDVGLMSRVAFMLDGLCRKFGLTGKSIFSLFMGYGCSTSAILTTRNLENESLRKRTAMIIPFASCSAKLPVFLVVSSLFFEKFKFLFVFGLYVLSIIVSCFVAVLTQKFLPANQDVFVLEIPKYRLPSLKKVLKDSLLVVKDFVFKIGFLILFFSSFVWVLQNFSLDFQFLNSQHFEKSILFKFADSISFLFKPIGLGDGSIVMALLFGVVAKEMIVVGLAMMNGVSGSIVELSASLISASSVCYFSPKSSIVFLIFVLLYSPCVSALSAIKNEFGFKQMMFTFCFQFLIAYAVSFLTYLVLTFEKFRLFLLLLFVFAMGAFCVLKLSKKHCKGNCYDCRKCKSS